MRLHIKRCECGCFAIKLDGERQFCRWLKGDYIEEVREQHDIVSEREDVCENCIRKMQTHVAMTAGSVH